MNLSKRAKQWLLWLFSSSVAILVLVSLMLGENTDKTVFMPGPLSDGHHQLADNCGACHTDAFGGGEVLQHSCVDCHGDERVKPFDSHPKAKFKDPRNAELNEKINALQCVTCHTEHKMQITQKDGLTQPADFCVHCHEGIGDERESHKDMDFMTCKDAGCHNFHDNRAIYTKYLIKHLGEPATLGEAFMPQREFASVIYELADYPIDKFPVTQLTEADIDAPHRSEVDTDIAQQWSATAHAKSGVNCGACHVVPPAEESIPVWKDDPQAEACQQCHSNEVERFQKGKHGMRLAAELSPMTPSQARLPMKSAAGHEQLTCNSCHDAHSFDVQQAAVDSCLGCHDDKHSLAYKQSKHYQLWQAELAGEAEAGSGVSCASCHMPRVNYDVSEWMSRTIVDHNQSANLSPNSKMIRSTCQNCHGLAFSLDAMADRDLIDSNFNGQPSVTIDTMRLAEQEKRRQQQAAEDDDDAGMFGF